MPEQSPQNLDLSANQQALRALNQWQLEGKIGVRLPDDNGSARVNWQQQGQDYNLSLSGPLGQGRVLIQGGPQQVTLTQSGEEPISAASAEALIRQATGWELPVSALRAWVLGLPVSDTALSNQQYREDDLPLSFTQLGWQLHYKRFHQQQGLWLPSLMTASTTTAADEKIRLTLVIHRWNLAPNSSEAAP
nr:lipoprotein insertase outer membrane protein LolB [Gilvimarinus xylanilyticus]